MSYLTEQDIRDEVVDRFPSDHDIRPDILFTPEDIQSAMRSAARAYNGIFPHVCFVTPECLSACDNTFVDAVVAALFRRMCNNVSLNEMEYSAGGVSVNTKGALKQNLDKLAKEYEARFRETATKHKVSMNIRAAYGRIG